MSARVVTLLGSLGVSLLLGGCMSASNGGPPDDTSSQTGSGSTTGTGQTTGSTGTGDPTAGEAAYDANATSKTNTQGAGGGAPLQDCAAAVGVVDRVPENQRTFDSADYAIHSLEAGVKPDAASVRVGDLLNYFAVPDVKPSVDLFIEKTQTGELATAVARMPVANANVTTGRLVIAIDTSLSMQKLRPLEDELAQAIEEANLGAVEVRSWTGQANPAADSNDPLPIDQINDAASVVNDVCGKGVDPSVPLHIVLFGDGRATTAGLEDSIKACGDAPVHVDGVMLVVDDPKASYHTSYLDPFFRLGGATSFVTDRHIASNGTTIYADKARFVSHIPAMFGEAVDNLRVEFEFPNEWIPVGSEGQFSSSSGTSGPALRRSAGTRGVAMFRQILKRDTAMGSSDCVKQTIDATFHFTGFGSATDLGGSVVSVPVPDLTMQDTGSTTAMFDYEQAVTAFAHVLRGAQHDEFVLAAETAIGTNACDTTQAPVCAALEKMKVLLAPYAM